jgi:hypothetical protein
MQNNDEKTEYPACDASEAELFKLNKNPAINNTLMRDSQQNVLLEVIRY